MHESLWYYNSSKNNKNNKKMPSLQQRLYLLIQYYIYNLFNYNKFFNIVFLIFFDKRNIVSKIALHRHYIEFGNIVLEICSTLRFDSFGIIVSLCRWNINSNSIYSKHKQEEYQQYSKFNSITAFYRISKHLITWWSIVLWILSISKDTIHIK